MNTTNFSRLGSNVPDPADEIIDEMFESPFAEDEAEDLVARALGQLPELPPTTQPDTPADPSRLGYPPTLPIEIALCVSPVSEICEAYDISPDRWSLLIHDKLFVEDLKRAKDMVAKEGMSFRLKAMLQSEQLLSTVWAMIHDKHTPATVKADLIKSVVKWGDLEPKNNVGTGTEGAAGFSININFSGNGRVING
jgi:hypothetical protein